jgi:hypothetical protein
LSAVCAQGSDAGGKRQTSLRAQVVGCEFLVFSGHDMQGGSVDSVFFSLRVQESFSEGLAPRQLLGT